MYENLSIKFCGLNFKNPFTMVALPISDSRKK